MKKNILDSISVKKQKAINEKIISPIGIGEYVSVAKKVLSDWCSDADKEKIVTVIVLKLYKNKLVVKQDNYSGTSNSLILKSDVLDRDIRKCGANPFNEKYNSVRPIAYGLDSIMHSLDLSKNRRKTPYIINGFIIKEMNWNPYVYNKIGQKEYYQRDFCWTLHDKQLLIESIYNGIDCGKILIRLHSWKSLENKSKSGETELAFKDIVDGKQRMETIQEFIFDEFPDMHGNYYSDLSKHSQYKFSNHQLFSYAEMSENTTDDEVIYQFLKMNFMGIPQSKEHLDFVKTIKGKL